MSKEPQTIDEFRRRALQGEYDKHCTRWKLLRQREDMLKLLIAEVEYEIDTEAAKMIKAAKKLEL